MTPLSTLFQHMGIDHGCLQFFMDQQGLDRTDIGASLQQMSGKAVPKGVRADSLSVIRSPQPYSNIVTN